MKYFLLEVSTNTYFRVYNISNSNGYNVDNSLDSIKCLKSLVA